VQVHVNINYIDMLDDDPGSLEYYVAGPEETDVVVVVKNSCPIAVIMPMKMELDNLQAPTHEAYDSAVTEEKLNKPAKTAEKAESESEPEAFKSYWVIDKVLPDGTRERMPFELTDEAEVGKFMKDLAEQTPGVEYEASEITADTVLAVYWDIFTPDVKGDDIFATTDEIALQQLVQEALILHPKKVVIAFQRRRFADGTQEAASEITPHTEFFILNGVRVTFQEQTKDSVAYRIIETGAVNNVTIGEWNDHAVRCVGFVAENAIETDDSVTETPESVGEAIEQEVEAEDDDTQEEEQPEEPEYPYQPPGSCVTCKHNTLPPGQEPCVTCNATQPVYSLWESGTK
jgi:hypothetical protein